jgi:hypothetical protein
MRFIHRSINPFRATERQDKAMKVKVNVRGAGKTRTISGNI